MGPTYILYTDVAAGPDVEWPLDVDRQRDRDYTLLSMFIRKIMIHVQLHMLGPCVSVDRRGEVRTKPCDQCAGSRSVSDPLPRGLPFM